MMLNCRRWAMACCGVLLLGASQGPTVQINAGGLTVHAQGIPLNELLSMLATQVRLTTIRMVDDNSLGTNRVSAHFSNLPLDQGIHHLMRDWNYALIREVRTGEIKLYILGPRSGSLGASALASEPLSLTVVVDEAVTEESKAENDADSALPYMEATLRSDLQSSDPAARRTALQNIESTEVGDSTIEDVRRLVQHDPDPEVRVAALDRLILYDPSEEAMQLLRNLTAGPDASLREVATEHLARIEEVNAITADVMLESKY